MKENCSNLPNAFFYLADWFSVFWKSLRWANISFTLTLQKSFLIPVVYVIPIFIHQFDAIIREVTHYLNTVGDASSVISQVDSMRELASHLRTSQKDVAVTNLPSNMVNSAIHKAKAWYTSAERFVQHLMKDFPLYCDLLTPFVAGVSQVSKKYI